ncbi:MAG TPA: DMT family transporter [Candidatus Dojkabacteria bacterium]|nr:DMT family transporter [Candidatus Dojkabacteria bacterium]
MGTAFFAEKFTVIKLIALIFAISGLVLIFNFSLKQNLLLPALAAIVSGGAGGAEVTFTKKVSERYSAIQISIFLWLVIFITHFFGSMLTQEQHLVPEFSQVWAGILGYAIASLLAFALVVKGFQYVEASIGALVGLLEIVVGIVLGLVFFSEQLTWQTIIGGLLIILAAALPNLQNLRKNKIKDSLKFPE